jgi:hypothetical protein
LSRSVEIDYVEIFPVRVTVPELKEGIGKVYASSKSLDGLAGISLMNKEKSEIYLYQIARANCGLPYHSLCDGKTALFNPSNLGGFFV